MCCWFRALPPSRRGGEHQSYYGSGRFGDTGRGHVGPHGARGWDALAIPPWWVLLVLFLFALVCCSLLIRGGGSSSDLGWSGYISRTSKYIVICDVRGGALSHGVSVCSCSWCLDYEQRRTNACVSYTNPVWWVLGQKKHKRDKKTMGQKGHLC